MTETHVWLLKIILAITGMTGIYYAQQLVVRVMEKFKTLFGFLIIFLLFLPYVRFISFLFDPISISIPFINVVSLIAAVGSILLGIIEGIMRHYDVIA